MADVKWIKLTVSMFDDEKIKIIESMPDKDAILIIWIKLLILAGKTNASGYLYLSQNIPYTDEMLSTLFNRPLSTVCMALEVFQKFNMIDVNDNGFIAISNWEKHQNIEGMEKIREQTRQRVAKYREQQKLECNVTVTQSNATEEERRKKNKKEDKESNIADKPHTHKFVIPKLEEIQEYCKERNNTVNAEKFFDFYQSKGWLVGKAAMKDWKACVRTWEQKEDKNNKKVADF
jgi:predicted phage replisome organizer